MGYHESVSVPKFEMLSPKGRELIDKAVNELVAEKIIPEDDAEAQREIRYQIAEIKPGGSEELKNSLKGPDGKPVVARRDQKEEVEGGGIGVTLVYGGATRAGGVNI